MRCVIDQSLNTEEASVYDALQAMVESSPKSLEEAFEQALNGVSTEQFTLK